MHYDLTPAAAGRAPRPLHHRVRRQRGRRVLRHHPRASARPSSRPAAHLTPAARQAGVGAGRGLHLQPRPLRPDAVRAGRRRAHQRQRVQEVPGGHAGRRLGHLRGHGPGGGQGRLARPRRVRRLHRRGRRRRHAGGGQPLRHPGHPADHARLDRAARDRGRPAAHRRQAHPQLGQPGGRRRARAPASTASCRWPGSTAPRWSAPASTPKARPAPRTGSCGPPGPSTTWPSTATGWRPRTCSSIPWSCRSAPAWRRAGGTGSRPSRASGG